MPAQVSDRWRAVEIGVPRLLHSHPPNGTSGSVMLTGPWWCRSLRAGGQGGECPNLEAPFHSPLAPLPSACAGWFFYHIKMFGLMGLTRLCGGMKKGPLFPRLLRCTLTYFFGGSGRPRRSQGWTVEVVVVERASCPSCACEGCTV